MYVFTLTIVLLHKTLTLWINSVFIGRVIALKSFLLFKYMIPILPSSANPNSVSSVYFYNYYFIDSILSIIKK